MAAPMTPVSSVYMRPDAAAYAAAGKVGICTNITGTKLTLGSATNLGVVSVTFETNWRTSFANSDDLMAIKVTVPFTNSVVGTPSYQSWIDANDAWSVATTAMSASDVTVSAGMVCVTLPFADRLFNPTAARTLKVMTTATLSGVISPANTITDPTPELRTAIVTVSFLAMQ